MIAKVMTRVCLHRQLTSMMAWYWRILSNDTSIHDTSKQLAVTNRNPAVSYRQHLIRYQYWYRYELYDTVSRAEINARQLCSGKHLKRFHRKLHHEGYRRITRIPRDGV